MADHPGTRPPQANRDPAELALAACYAPRIFLDQEEPFLPLVVGYTIFRFLSATQIDVLVYELYGRE
ncbi:MAG: hypothetical protein V3T90_12705 [Anaerolineae bacterium]